MYRFLPTIILRHRKENLKKCSLRGLETREDLCFLTYPLDPMPILKEQIILVMDAPPLTQNDQGHGLFLIDGTWKYAEVMQRQVQGQYIERSIPLHFRTSYPRKQTGCADPNRGLASVEALFIAYHILGYNTEGLLDYYYWKKPFLKLNPSLL